MLPLHALRPTTIRTPRSIPSRPPSQFQNTASQTYTIVHNITLRHRSISACTSPPFTSLRTLSPTLPLPTRRLRHRLLSTTPTSLAAPSVPPSTEPTPLSTDEYHRLSDAYIDTLVAQLEAMQEEREDVDVEYSAGVLTLTLPPHGTYVLNKQPPNKQIWLSSPVSGPKRYDWVASKTGGGEAPDGGLEEGKEGEWVYLRDGSTLSDLLRREVGVDMEGL